MKDTMVDYVSLLNDLQEDMTIDFKNDERLKNLYKTINKYIYGEDRLDEDDILLLEAILKLASFTYNNIGEVIMSDDDYNKLEALYNSYGNRELIGSVIGDKTRISTHDYPDLRGTLNKIYSIYSNTIKNTGVSKAKASYEEWLSYIENKLGYKIPDDTLILLQPKIDGVSIEFSCDKEGNVYKALTRGNVETNEAREVTDFFIPMQFEEIGKRDNEYGVKTEVYMRYKNFDKVAEKYGLKTPLSAVSSIINTEPPNKDMKKYINIAILRVQEKGSDDIPPHIFEGDHYTAYIRDYKSIEDSIKKIRKQSKDYPIDGVVIIILDEDIRKDLGRENHKSLYEIAYKFPPEEKVSKILNIEWQTGLLGNLTPVAKIEPVKLKGKTISSISLGSKDRFMSLDLHENDDVLIKYDIIPYLDMIPQEHGYRRKFALPTICNICGSELDRDTLICSNNDCDSKAIGKILNFIKKVGIDFISDATVEVFYINNIVRNIADLYKIDNKKEDILNLKGFGKKSYNNILKSIEDKSVLTVDILLGSLGIQGIGRKIFKSILEIYNYKELMDIVKKNDVDTLCGIKGISNKTAKAIIEGINKNKDLLKELNKLITILEYKRNEGKDYHTKVYMTKIRDPKFSEYLDSIGVLHSADFNKSIDYLIIKDNSVESKKIGKYNIPVLTLEEAYNKFNYKGMI